MNYLKRYIDTDYRFDKVTKAAVFSMLLAVAGFYGFVYEIIFYYFDGGMQKVYWRGSSFGPWIKIYGFGALIIYFLVYRFKRKPLLVFAVGGLGCGLFELLSGAVLYYCFEFRAWDYNTERWNFGNIGGFICLRSVVMFALSSLALVYIVLPLIFFISGKMNKKAFAILAFTLGALFVLDNIYNLLIAPQFPALMNANAFYEQLGLGTIKYN